MISEKNLMVKMIIGRKDLGEQLNKYKGNTFVKCKNVESVMDLKVHYNNILN